MNTLAIDTATSRASVAIVRDGIVLAERSLEAPRSQTEDLIPLVDGTLGDAGLSVTDIDEVVVGVGPGPFTGLRVGIVTGVMLAQGLHVPVHGVLSLDACAAKVIADSAPTEPFVVTIDAKRGEVFWARYAPDGTRVEGPAVGADVAGISVFPPASALATCLTRVPATPVYLREPDATVPGAPKKVSR